jgi:transposase
MGYRWGGGLTRQGQAERELRRLQAASMFEQNMTQAQVAGHLKVSSMTASRWYRAWERGGTAALLSKGTYGAVCKLTAQQQTRLQTELDRGAVACGWDEDRWTLKRIGTVITRLFGVTYTESGVVVPDGTPELVVSAARDPAHQP